MEAAKRWPLLPLVPFVPSNSGVASDTAPSLHCRGKRGFKRRGLLERLQPMAGHSFGVSGYFAVTGSLAPGRCHASSYGTRPVLKWARAFPKQLSCTAPNGGPREVGYRILKTEGTIQRQRELCKGMDHFFLTVKNGLRFVPSSYANTHKTHDNLG